MLPLQSDGWTKELPKYLPWLKRTSPYYNLISDESQIWQGEAGSQRPPSGMAQLWKLALKSMHPLGIRPCRHQRRATRCWGPCHRSPAALQFAVPHEPCSSTLPAYACLPSPPAGCCAAELNLAWSWHEIVSDYVRPTLVWLEKKGKADLDALVKQYDLHGNLRCLTENQEGCA